MNLTNQIGVLYFLMFKGHEDWVYSVCWCLNHGIDQSDCSAAEQRMQLLSSSMDKTVILWKPDPLSGVWLEEVKTEIQEQKSSLVLVHVIFSPPFCR